MRQVVYDKLFCVFSLLQTGTAQKRFSFTRSFLVLSTSFIIRSQLRFPVHKVILYIHSKYFRKLFAGPLKVDECDSHDT